MRWYCRCLFWIKTSGIVEIKYTKTEIEVNRLAKINPEIINLVRTFDLLDGDDNAIIILIKLGF
jgi:hypothetical protein